MEQLMNMDATSIVALFQTNKVQRHSFAIQIIDSVVEGNVSPLNIHLQLKSMEDIIETIKADVSYKNAILTEVEKNGKSFEYQNAKFDIRETGVKYDYSVCNDLVYNDLKDQIVFLTEKLKDREKFLKQIPSDGATIVDKISGEVCELYPPSKSSTTSTIVTLK